MDYLEGSCIWCGNDTYTMFFEHEDIRKVVIKRFCCTQCDIEYHNTVLNPPPKKEEKEEKEEKPKDVTKES
jgi:thioredoxin-related protein